MATILVLNSSVYGDASVSRTLVGEAIRRLQAEDPDARVIEHDLGTTPPAPSEHGNPRRCSGYAATCWASWA